MSLITSSDSREALCWSVACPDNTTSTLAEAVESNPDSYPYNLVQLLQSLSLNATHTDTGFYTTTAGRSTTEQAYGMFLCRGDVSTDVCRECMTFANLEAVQLCLDGTDAMIWNDECMVRYSNKKLVFSMNESSSHGQFYGSTEKEPSGYSQVLATSVHELTTEAANNSKYFATKEAKVKGSNETVYSLAQCTQDISASNCKRCLARAAEKILVQSEFRGRQVLYPSCSIRLDNTLFYAINWTHAQHPPTPEALPPPSTLLPNLRLPIGKVPCARKKDLRHQL
ncbi:putative cysteine-rich receptor-like protein kinase 9 [Malus domestica]|uniref:putative cysteine-rich receptor-like protein kinase 9 n=1 Tax=Malus domestica TaxID=3750 RepID=UPI0007ECC3AB